MQNNIINSLQQSHQVLSMTTTTINQSENFLDLKNNPFSLLNFLCNISKTLTSISIKSPYQIMYLKSNSFILDCIVKISNYFETKNIKMYKFM